MIDQASDGLPIEILTPKSRKRGVSTFAEAWGRELAKFNQNWNSLTVAHQADATEEIFGIAKRIHVNDMDEGDIPATKRTIVFPKMGSKYRCMTAMGSFGASGSDTHALHVSEAALIENNSGQDAENLAAMFNSMPQNVSMTSKIIEGTGNGPKGMFPEMCFKAEKGESSYKLVFISWLEDPDLVDDAFRGGYEDFEPALTEYEKGLVDEFKATPKQLAWRRNKISNDHPEWKLGEGNPPIFGYHYPARLAECFATVAGAIYPRFSLSRHVKHIETNENWDYYGGIDWGWSGDHAFVYATVAHNPSAPPMMTIDTDCPVDFAKEMQSYSADPKTGQPIKKGDHFCDLIRYVICTAKLRGHVHVSKGVYQLGAAHHGPAGMARMIHECRGYYPSTENETDLAKYVPRGTVPNYLFCVADRSQSGLITQFCNWGIPTIPHGKPDQRDNSRGEVWDGISEVATLLAGDTLFNSLVVDPEEALFDKAYDKFLAGKIPQMTDDELDAIRRDRGLLSVQRGRDEEEYIPHQDFY